MKEVKVKLYDYSELSPEAQERALQDWNKDNDDPMLPAHLGNLIKEELDGRGIKYISESITALYSLGHSQGDGLMFEGNVTWKGFDIFIEHSGRYYHEMSAKFDYKDEDITEVEQAEFEKIYREVCVMVRDAGYNEIEYQESAEHFGEVCEANEYTFEANGAMRNA